MGALFPRKPTWVRTSVLSSFSVGMDKSSMAQEAVGTATIKADRLDKTTSRRLATKALVGPLLLEENAHEVAGDNRKDPITRVARRKLRDIMALENFQWRFR